MIAFRYSKTGGAEFISHLDTLRHLNKTFERAGIKVKYSQGFHPHMLVYMSSPIAVGLQSYAEYCTVETDCPAEEFKQKFNEFSPKGIKCIEAYSVEKNPNFASIITRAKYFIEGLPTIDCKKVLEMETFTVQDKKGEEKDVREKIYSFSERDGGYEVILAGGNNALRPDAFVKTLMSIYGEAEVEITKEESFIGEGEEVSSLLK